MPPSKNSLPVFPAFLFPSFKLPFRRRRTRSPSPSRPGWHIAPHTVDTQGSPVPSLSCSPTSSSDDSDPVSPSDFDGLSSPLDLDWGGSEDQYEASPGETKPTTLRRVQPDILRCWQCAAHLAYGAQIVSKGFTGRHGRAFLVSPPSSLSTTPPALGIDSSPYGVSKADAEEQGDSELFNVKIGRKENRQLVTGAHVVADISCAVCSLKFGWKYVEASEESQKYKEGKFILEATRVVAYRSWEDVGLPSGESRTDTRQTTEEKRRESLRSSVDSETGAVEDIVEASKNTNNDPDRAVTFDSEDEDECEDIFAGTWDPAVVSRRRRTKVSRLRGKEANRRT